MHEATRDVLEKLVEERDRYKAALDHIASDKLECERCRDLVGLRKLASHYENIADEALAERESQQALRSDE